MKKEIQGKILKTYTLLLTAVCLMACFTDAEAQGNNIDYSKYGRKGAKARKAWLQIPEKQYDPNTKAYCDALWMRVHEENCPMLVLKDKKKVITLEQADKEGWRIGESGQSGRSRCCFKGYRRKYPEADIPEDANGIVQKMKSGKIKWHYAGCHRITVSPNYVAMTPIEAEARGAKEEGFYMCPHCIERGPSLTTADMETLRQRPAPPTFTPPEGWTPEPFSPDKLPSKEEVDILIQQTLANGYAIQEAPYTDPIASLEEFMGRRFFFPVGNWLSFYQAYRATGDKRILEALRISARHYRDLCVDYPDVAQLKARDPEGMAFMYSMAVSARLTLQLAREHPDRVSGQEIAEAGSFLDAIVATLKPVCEGDDNLDPEMGIPQDLADDFRNRAFNRALNGIGTIAMATAALEDLQALEETASYETTVDRYRTCVREYFKNWKSVGSLTTEADGRAYFYYPYKANDRTKMVDGVKIVYGADDQGHFSHSMQGVLLVHDATPELGADDAFMTAIANSVYHNSYTRHGSIQSPAADKIKPANRKPFGAPRDRFYLFEAFRDGVIDGQNSKLSAEQRVQQNSDYSSRLKTLHAHYLEALREDRSLVHLGEIMLGEKFSQQKEEQQARERKSIIDRLQPIPVDSGFKQDGYFVWCGSMIRVGDRYHLFSSRWPKGTGDPDDLVGILDGYRKHSEIVRATADNPMGPFKFEEVVLAGRGGDYWDGQSCHGPKIVKVKDKFVLYYQAIARDSKLRKIGYAWSDNIEGPWTRCESEIPLTEDANNPGPYVREDGSVLLAFRTKSLVMHVAEAEAFDCEYKVIAENIFPGGKVEDPDLYFADGKHHMVMNDVHGAISGTVRNGGHLVSEDAIDWRPYEHPRAYSHDLVWRDGTSWTAKRRERPDFFNDRTGVKGEGEPTHLITGVLYNGDSWTVVQEIAPESTLFDDEN